MGRSLASRSSSAIASFALALLGAVALAPSAAFGQAAPAASAPAASPGAKKKGAADPTAAAKATFVEACVEGSTKYAARDFPASVQAFQKAIELSPRNALGHYFLGEAQLAAGNLTEAEAAWNRASLEANEQDPSLRARVLFVIADLKERQKKWDDAKAAWQVYLDWAAKYPKANTYVGSGQSRQQVIDAMQAQDRAVAVVRQRIAETKNGGVFTDLTKAGPAPAPAAAPSAAPAAPPAK